MKKQNKYHTLIAGGGIAGLVTALELAKSGQQIIIVDRDTKERIGGLARWAFGGMALCGTAEQKRQNIPDSPELLLKDWHSFANFGEDDYWPKAWAKDYAENNHEMVYMWLKSLGAKFLPAVNWVERGLFNRGNSVPRYHILWGTGWHLAELIIKHLQPFIDNKQLTILHQHKVENLICKKQQVIGAEVIDEISGEKYSINADQVVLACGGINGSTERVRQNWPTSWSKLPETLLNGANPISDGKLHDCVAELDGNITHQDKMWNYAAGIPHPQPEFKGHGLSLVPCKSALWMDHTGKRIGPMPLVTGFDTNYLCQQVANQEKPWTWQILNWKIAAKEFAVSGSQHNPHIRNKNLFKLLKDTLLGNHRLIHQMVDECEDFICADSLPELVDKMNKRTQKPYVDKEVLYAEINEYDQKIKRGITYCNDDQTRRIQHARQWRPDKLRTCAPQAIIDKKAGPLIAIKVQLISRKSLGGVQTNLKGQVLNQAKNSIAGLYCVGEAAGFGGGGASGFRSLEGTFLSGCILTARHAASAIISIQE
ncbi:MAG: FAD-binding dehydrogenase [Gammaproteobacteria bacterium]|nr:MAG: FAD-binding dehydrogenase [Gammaproteobacteria bacterium]PHR83838.1 MAG: FAD-binding dehydrogenase [Colwellia sp.]